MSRKCAGYHLLPVINKYLIAAGFGNISLFGNPEVFLKFLGLFDKYLQPWPPDA
jgi:hypothetical protein